MRSISGSIFERLKNSITEFEGTHPELRPLPQGHHKWCPSGLQDWSPVPEGNSDQGLGTGAGDLTRCGPVALGCPGVVEDVFHI